MNNAFLQYKAGFKQHPWMSLFFTILILVFVSQVVSAFLVVNEMFTLQPSVDFRFFVLLFLRVLVNYLFFFAGQYYLTTCLYTIIQNIPFDIKQYKRLNRAGLILMLSPVYILLSDSSNMIYYMYKPDYLFGYFRNDGFTSFFFGAFLLVFAQVFKKGSFIQQENDLTV